MHLQASSRKRYQPTKLGERTCASPPTVSTFSTSLSLFIVAERCALPFPLLPSFFLLLPPHSPSSPRRFLASFNGVFLYLGAHSYILREAFHSHERNCVTFLCRVHNEHNERVCLIRRNGECRQQRDRNDDDRPDDVPARCNADSE